MKCETVALLVAIVLSGGCVSNSEYYLRSNKTGLLEGPFLNTEGSRVLEYIVALPKEEELKLIEELKATRLLKIFLDEVEIVEVVKTLNRLQEELKGEGAVPIHVNLKGYLHPDFPEDYSVFLSSNGRDLFGSDEYISDPFDDDREEKEQKYNRAKRVVPKFTCEASDISLYDMLELVSRWTGLPIKIEEGSVVLQQNRAREPNHALDRRE